MELPRLRVLTLYSNQIEATKKFYEAVGFSFEWHNFDWRILDKSLGYYTSTSSFIGLEIRPRGYDAPQSVHNTQDFVVGNAQKFAFRVASIETAIQALRDIGVPAQEHQPHSGQARNCLVRDPDGREVRLVEDTS